MLWLPGYDSPHTYKFVSACAHCDNQDLNWNNRQNKTDELCSLIENITATAYVVKTITFGKTL